MLHRSGISTGSGSREKSRDRKKGRPPSLSAATAVPHTDRLRSELSPPFFSCSPPLAELPVGRVNKGPSFDPQASWPAHLVHPCKRCGSGRVADRPSALHPEAPNRGGWSTRLAPTVRIGWPPGSPEPSSAQGTSCSSPDDPSGPELSKQPLMSSASTSPWT